MKWDGSIFHSGVARKIFVLFVVSTLIPLTSLVLVSYRQIKELFNDHVEQQLRRDTKAIGMLLVDRLSYLEDQLKLVGRYRERARTNVPFGSIVLPDSDMARDYTRLTWKSVSGENIALRGEPITLTRTSMTTLDPGTSQLLAIPPNQRDRPAAIYLIHRLSPLVGGYLVGEVKPSTIWKFNLDPEVLYWIQREDGGLLATSAPHTKRPDHEPRSEGHSTSGTFHWSLAGESQLAAYWTLFLAYRYRSPNWVVTLSTPLPRLEAHYPHHQRVILPIVGVSLLMVTLLSISLIRHYLVPLERLKEGTRRIAERDFSTPVRVKSGDEFEQLADAFNTMATQLDNQFHMLSSLAALDRATLAAQDREHIGHILLVSLKDIISYDLIAIWLFDPARPTHARLLFDEPERRASGDEVVVLTELDLAELCASKPFLIHSPISPSMRYLQPLLNSQWQSFLVLPIVLKQGISAALCFAFKDEHRAQQEMEKLQDLADRISVAFANAAWREQLHHQAYHDPLTDLPNRLLLKDRLGQAISRSERTGSRIALLFIDLDRFKDVNNTLGHAVGDQLLIRVAQTLKMVTRSTDTLVRLGGDEFTILIPDIPVREDAAGVAEKVAQHALTALAAPIVLAGQEIRIGASIGIALYPENGHLMDEVLRNADMAMYHAKDSGRGDYKFYSSRLSEMAVEHVRLGKALRQALERQEFCIHFQPKIRARDGMLAGAEALLRWVHPEEGMVSPKDFLPFAEESGLILPISDWILEAVGREIQGWRDQGLEVPAVSINISAYQFSRRDLIESTRRLVEKRALNPGLIEFEVTESMAMEDIELTITILKRLKELGIRTSLDDFGTGHSSLSYLKRLPLNILKIDQSFVSGLPFDPESASFVRTIIALAHSRGLEVVAEGVETEQQLRWLQEQGCEYLQGFLFSPAIAAGEFAVRYLKPVAA